MTLLDTCLGSSHYDLYPYDGERFSVNTYSPHNQPSPLFLWDTTIVLWLVIFVVELVLPQT